MYFSLLGVIQRVDIKNKLGILDSHYNIGISNKNFCGNTPRKTKRKNLNFFFQKCSQKIKLLKYLKDLPNYKTPKLAFVAL